MISVPTDEKVLKTFIARRHPEYAGMLDHWNFLEATYRGGRAWFDGNIFRYLKEGDDEFSERLARAYRFNHTREVVDLVNKYIFRADIARREEDADQVVKNFWKHATREGADINQFMERVGRASSVWGRGWIMVDNPLRVAPISVADEKNVDSNVYAYIVRPQHVLDMSYDESGSMRWVLLFEPQRDDGDPFTSSGGFVERYRLWTTEAWFLFEVKREGRKTVVRKVADGQHNLNEVPLVPSDHLETDDLYTAPALIGDIAYLDRAVANYLSNLDAIIQDQTFSQLAMPAQGLMPGEDGYNKLIEMGTKRIFTFDGEGGVKPEFLSPDPKQANVIIAVINKIINEIYHSVGMGGERTKEDNAVGIDNSSGVAKAFDFDRMNSLLVGKAKGLERTENRITRLVRKWHGQEPDDNERSLVKYPDNYDVRGLYDEFDIASRLALIEAPDGTRRQQMEMVIEKLFPHIKDSLKRALMSELKDWPPEAPAPLAARPELQDATKENRQGQVVEDNDAEAA